MHSPWVSRWLSDLGHEVIVAHARKVRLIGENRRKDDRFDARTLARLARIDPDLRGRHNTAVEKRKRIQLSSGRGRTLRLLQAVLGKFIRRL